MSLCFSDLVSAMLSPICVYRVTWGYLEWKRISFLCKVSLFNKLFRKNFCFLDLVALMNISKKNTRDPFS